MGEEMLTMEECLQMAARAWCQPETSNMVMEPLLAVAFAQILYDFANRTIDAPECGHLWRTTVTGRCTICGVEVPEEEWDPQRCEPTPSPAAAPCPPHDFYETEPLLMVCSKCGDEVYTVVGDASPAAPRCERCGGLGCNTDPDGRPVQEWPCPACAAKEAP